MSDGMIMTSQVMTSQLVAATPAPLRVQVMGVPVDCVTEATAVALSLQAITQRRQLRIVPINAAQTILAHEDAQFRETIQQFELALADGKAVAWGAKWWLRLPVPEQVGVPPFVHKLLPAATAQGARVFLFGATDEVVHATAARCQAWWPTLEIAGVRNGYFSPQEEAGVVAQINASGAEILLVALPSPMKELWVTRQSAALQPPVIVGVGGLFDVMAGKVKAAPEPIRMIGLEWVFRMLQEPGRLWRRYMTTTPLYVYRLLRHYEPPGAQARG